MSKEFWVDLGAGWAAGGASVLASQPVDTVLTRVQLAQAAPKQPGARSQAWSLASRIVSEGGTRALWRGSTPMTMVIPLQNALLFAGYGIGERWVKESSHAKNSTASLLPVFVGGFTGGVIQSFIVSPVELLKIRQQSNGGSLISCASKVGATVGAPALWRGLSATLLRDGMPHGVWFLSYEWCKNTLSFKKGSEAQKEGAWIPLLSGSFAATVAWGVGYPFDTIKTRIQAIAATGTKPPGVLETSAQMLKETQGNATRAFYRGFGLKLARAIPSSAIGFVVYEEVAGMLLGNK